VQLALASRRSSSVRRKWPALWLGAWLATDLLWSMVLPPPLDNAVYLAGLVGWGCLVLAMRPIPASFNAGLVRAQSLRSTASV
jgi:hypothetical protein